MANTVVLFCLSIKTILVFVDTLYPSTMQTIQLIRKQYSIDIEIH